MGPKSDYSDFDLDLFFPAKGQYDQWGEYYSVEEFEDEIFRPQVLEIKKVLQIRCLNCQRKYPTTGPVEVEPWNCRFWNIQIAAQVKVAAMHISFKMRPYILERLWLLGQPSPLSSDVTYLKIVKTQFWQLQTEWAGSFASLMTQLYDEFAKLDIILLTQDLDLIFRNTALRVEEVISLYCVIEELGGWEASFCQCSGWVISDASNRKFFETPSYPETAAEAENFVCSLFRTTLYRSLLDYVNSLKLD